MNLTAVALLMQGAIIRWFFRLVAIPTLTLELAVMLGLVYIPAGTAPEINLSVEEMPNRSSDYSLEALYQLRNRFRAKSQTANVVAYFASPVQAFRASVPEFRSLQALNNRIHIEETAQAHWDRALKLSQKAVKLGKNPKLTPKILVQSRRLWKEAIQALSQIPSESFLASAAARKQANYHRQLDEIAYRYDVVRSGFLISIAEKTGLSPSRIHITVCRTDRECRRLNGNQPTASPASLIKLPIAVALMQKLSEERSALDAEIRIDRHNYTEDAADIWVGHRYSLRYVLLRMLNQSSNIATNQLIDYLGFPYINEVMRDRGYDTICVGNKLVGETTFPENFGVRGSNQITTDELTEMMIQIYNSDHPNDDVLIAALLSQTDWRMGRAAFNIDDATWLGEKTGWNSKVLGTTTAATIAGDRYIMTIAFDYSANVAAMRQVMGDIAAHILENDGF